MLIHRLLLMQAFINKGGMDIMKNYFEPEMEIRKYALPLNEFITTSDPDQNDPGLDDGTPHGDIFG